MARRQVLQTTTAATFSTGVSIMPLPSACGRRRPWFTTDALRAAALLRQLNGRSCRPAGGPVRPALPGQPKDDDNRQVSWLAGRRLAGRLLRSFSQWPCDRRLAADSCRDSRGFAPHSRFHPPRGKPVARGVIGMLPPRRQPVWLSYPKCAARRPDAEP